MRAGLSATPKTLPPKWFYDARGSGAVRRDHPAAGVLPDPRASGRSSAAQAGEIAAAHRRRHPRRARLRHVGEDPAAARRADRGRARCAALRALRRATSRSSRRPASQIAAEYPGVEVHGVVGDFEHHLPLLPTGGAGSSRSSAARSATSMPASGRQFLADLSRATLAARRHAAARHRPGEGRRPAWSRPTTTPRASPPSSTRTCCGCSTASSTPTSTSDGVRGTSRVWDAEHEWIEMRLESAARPDACTVAALDLAVDFAAGEEVRTEISAKFRRERVEAELAAAGLDARRSWWTDADGDFGLSLARKPLRGVSGAGLGRRPAATRGRAPRRRPPAGVASAATLGGGGGAPAGRGRPRRVRRRGRGGAAARRRSRRARPGWSGSARTTSPSPTAPAPPSRPCWPPGRSAGGPGSAPSAASTAANARALARLAAERGWELVTLPVDALGRVVEVPGPARPAHPARRWPASAAWSSPSPTSLATGVPLVLDVAQSLGQTPVPTGCAAYLGTSRKWLCGPRGVGFTVLDPAHQDGLLSSRRRWPRPRRWACGASRRRRRTWPAGPGWPWLRGSGPRRCCRWCTPSPRGPGPSSTAPAAGGWWSRWRSRPASPPCSRPRGRPGGDHAPAARRRGGAQRGTGQPGGRPRPAGAAGEHRGLGPARPVQRPAGLPAGGGPARRQGRYPVAATASTTPYP